MTSSPTQNHSQPSAQALKTGKAKLYKSPPRKLVSFFEHSRDQWKAKCLDAKASVKRHRNRLRFFATSHARWKHRVTALKVELAQLKAQVRAKDKEIADLKKKRSAQAPRLGQGLAAFRQMVPYHTYSVGHVLWFVSLVLASASSLRGASRAMDVSLAVFQLPYAAPSWCTGRLWLLRLGYYKLTRAKEQADDWVWIVDHTVQLGTEKCLVILGVRLSAFPAQGRCLTHEDVEPLTLLPVTQSNGDIVYQQLQETVEKTGIPRQIVSDQGSDLHAGVKAFCQAHVETCAIYDIKHTTACVLKHELHNDEPWLRFTHLAAQSKLKVQQTALAFLAPPHQRSKARYMNSEVLVGWGKQLLLVVDQQERLRDQHVDLSLFEEKLGWIRDFRWHLQEWGELMQVIEVTEHVVRSQGLYRGVHRELKSLLAPVAHLPRAQQVSTQLVAFVAEQSFKARPHECLVGSSEVIESVFGKLKHLERDQAKGGFTGLILSIAAMVSTTTTEVIQKALATVPTKRALTWCKEVLGQSVQAKRRKAFAAPKETEQKRDQFKVAV